METGGLFFCVCVIILGFVRSEASVAMKRVYRTLARSDLVYSTFSSASHHEGAGGFLCKTEQSARGIVPFALRPEPSLFYETPQRQDVRRRSHHTYLLRTQLRKKLESEIKIPGGPDPLRHGVVHP
jgi:hypothetical protein